MKQMFLILLSAVACLYSCSDREPGLLLVNETKLDRIDEPVTLAKNALVRLIGAIPENRIPILVSSEADTIPFQLDDLDGDNSWDEMFFLVSIKAGSKQKIYFRFADRTLMPSFSKRVNVQFMKAVPPYDRISLAERLKSNGTEISSAAFFMDGPVWENDLVAFRNYFDARNGMDIFGKKVTRMVFGDTSLVHQDYHQMQNWGMDILKVANSLGAGALGMSLNNKVYRIDSAEKSTCRILSYGPLRAVLLFDFEGWKAEGRSYDILHQVSIWGGSPCYQSKVTVSGLHGDEELLTGIVNLHSDSLMLEKVNKSVVIAATHDKQGFLGENLGMGILMNSADFVDTVAAPEEGEGIVQTYLLKIKLTENVPVVFRFYSAWEYQDPDYASREKFMGRLRLEAEKMSSPLRIKGI
jgi:Domain of unknown function (DUF4861)